MDKDILLQCSLGIDVIENFDYMNRVSKPNWKYTIFYISPRATLKETFTANISGVLPEHPKLDQNPTFTPLSKTTRIPAPFMWEFPPGCV